MKMSLFGGRKSEKASSNKADDLIPKPKTTPPVTRQPVGFETVLGSNSTLLGELRSQADVRLDRTFEGTLEIEGNVLVGETGKVNADIHAKNVSVAGAVRGDISGKKVQLLRTARVWGNISASAITTEEGAF
ncbi:MAG TPA: polymer-forming cytoskeletal protein, partial [Aggregatilineales bacterium]|nr:polymer-forming cytoskeletal protein [Aggregatilineales bacterium]